MKDIIVRKMLNRDVDEVAHIEEVTFSMPWKREDFLEMIEKTYAHYYVAELDGEVAGICGFRDIAGEGEITNVAVREDLRGYHIGKRLLEKVLEDAVQRDVKDITLEVRESNTVAIKLYESFGFETEGKRPGFYEKPKEDALIMWRRI